MNFQTDLWTTLDRYKNNIYTFFWYFGRDYWSIIGFMYHVRQVQKWFTPFCWHFGTSYWSIINAATLWLEHVTRKVKYVIANSFGHDFFLNVKKLVVYITTKSIFKFSIEYIHSGHIHTFAFCHLDTRHTWTEQWRINQSFL